MPAAAAALPLRDAVLDGVAALLGVLAAALALWSARSVPVTATEPRPPGAEAAGSEGERAWHARLVSAHRLRGNLFSGAALSLLAASGSAAAVAYARGAGGAPCGGAGEAETLMQASDAYASTVGLAALAAAVVATHAPVRVGPGAALAWLLHAMFMALLRARMGGAAEVFWRAAAWPSVAAVAFTAAHAPDRADRRWLLAAVAALLASAAAPDSACAEGAPGAAARALHAAAAFCVAHAVEPPVRGGGDGGGGGARGENGDGDGDGDASRPKQE